MSERYEMTGTIKEITPVVEVGANKMRKRHIVLHENGSKFDDSIVVFDLLKNQCELADGHHDGEEVTISFNPQGNIYNGRYYSGNRAWKIAHHGDAEPMMPPAGSDASAPAGNGDDNIPF